MAKIGCIALFSENDGDLNKTVVFKQISITVKQKFHPLNVKLQMDYRLHLFVLLNTATVSSVLIFTHWDEVRCIYYSCSERDV